MRRPFAEAGQMKYQSTRGGGTPVDFCRAVMAGLAQDGGLLVPQSFPDFSSELEGWRDLPYPELAFRVMSPFVGDLGTEELKKICEQVYHPDNYGAPVAPLEKVGPRYLLRLDQGPTLAFKDVALQFLGQVFETILQRHGGRLNVVAATSGDTGSAAISGLRGRDRIAIFVMHPRGRIAPLQELQMTTELSANVHNLAVEGTFDDCQLLMKSLSRDLEFKSAHAIGAVNSVNWARILAQMVYYFAAYLQLDPGDHPVLAVPTGNFGNILAGVYAHRCGLPVKNFVLASNRNDILPRFFNEGVYSRGEVHATLAPAMDIQVASNFERYLYLLAEGNCEKVRGWMESIESREPIRIEQEHPTLIQAASVNDEEVVETISRVHREFGRVIDPHTATAWCACDRLQPEGKVVVLATAHPAKFEEAVTRALGRPERHSKLEALRDLPARCHQLPNSLDELKALVAARGV